MLSPLLKLLGLDKLPEGKLRFRKKVHNMCEDEASQSFEELKVLFPVKSGKEPVCLRCVCYCLENLVEDVPKETIVL